MKRIIAVLFLLNLQAVVLAQVWEFKDSRPNGKTGPLQIHNGAAIVDVSSILFIDLKKDSIRAAITSKISQGDDLQELLDKALTLQKISMEGLALLPEFSASLQNLGMAQTEEEKVVIIRKAYGRVSGFALSIISAAENDPILYERLTQALEQSVRERGGSELQYRLVFSAVLDYARELKTDLDKVLKEEGVYLQMAATLFSQSGLKTPIHFDDFDNFATPDFFDPYALNLALTDNQKKQLQQIDSLSKKINKHGLNNEMQQSLRSFQVSAFDPILLDLEKCLETLLKSLTNIVNPQLALAEGIKYEVQTLKVQVESTLSLLKNLRSESFSTGTGAAVPKENLFKNLNQLQGSFLKIKNQSQNIRYLLTTLGQGLPAMIQRVVDETEKDLTSCGIRQVQIVDSTLQLSVFQITGFRTLDQINSLVVEFTDEVFKLSLNDLPEHATMDIKNRGGVRDEGDNIVLELRAGKVGIAPVTISREYFTLMKTQPYLRLDVGLIFVNHLQQSNDGTFQAAPATSILFKFGTKGKSTFYRKFLDFGVGINTASLNFDPDKDLEFGAALIGTAFKDYLQSGIGYNFSAGSPYFLVGVRIPFLNKEFSFSAQ